MEDEASHSRGLTGAFRRLAEALLSTAQNRFELLATELQEEKNWLIATLLWTAAAIFFCGLAIIFVAGTVVYITPDGARPWVLAAFCVIFLYLATSAIVGLRRALKDKPPPLADTIGELKKDIDWIRSRD